MLPKVPWVLDFPLSDVDQGSSCSIHSALPLLDYLTPMSSAPDFADEPSALFVKPPGWIEREGCSDQVRHTLRGCLPSNPRSYFHSAPAANHPILHRNAIISCRSSAEHDSSAWLAMERYEIVLS